MSEKRILHKKTVKSVREVAFGVYILSLQRDFSFKPGQVIAVDLVPDGRPRLYSIASGTKDVDLEILFDEKKNGQLTPFLSKLQAGDSIYVSEPFGTYSTQPGKGFWIASGTGIAPFVSMLRSGMADEKSLIHGSRLDENFYYSDLIESLMGSDRFIRCCSQQEDTRYYKGRLTAWLREHKNLPGDAKYYLCGSPEMVVEVRDLLIAKGIPFHNVVCETYF